MAESNLFKDQLDKAAIEHIAKILKQVDRRFAVDEFIELAATGIEAFELKQRVEHIIAALSQSLPSDFGETAPILMTVAKHWPEPLEQQNWSSFSAWPLIDYVKSHGLEQPQLAFKVLEKLTPLFTAEFAIRPFLEQHFELAYQQMLDWCEHPDEHVRRLASEGIRPRLPWASHLNFLRENPQPIWTILDKLKADDSAYVRRSVANNLNDISKDHPEKVIDICRQWQKTPHPHSEWVMRHGLRSLVKSGYADVYPLLGYMAEPDLKVRNFRLQQDCIQLGDNLLLMLELASSNAQQQKLVVDYQVAFVKADGSLSRKVFKWKNISLPAQGKLTLEKQHAFKPISTRRYYPGKHLVECLINGKVFAQAEFELRVE